MIPIPQKMGRDMPLIEFIDEVAGIYFRSILLVDAGMLVPQHKHDHDHATYVGSGKVRYWVDGEWKADVEAGHAIEIKAGCEHMFQSLVPDTRLTCVHDVKSAEAIKNHESKHD